MGATINFQGEVVENPWQFFHEEAMPQAWRKADYPLVYWRDAVEVLPHLPSLAVRVGVWLKTEDDVHAFAKAVGDVNRLALIAVNVPRFTDGRITSIGTLLRRRYVYVGELRALGDVLADQLVQWSRSGIDSFTLREDRADATAVANARKALSVLTKHYQPNLVHHHEAVSFA
jgi:uncharacterized protein (DUF934 family)